MRNGEGKIITMSNKNPKVWGPDYWALLFQKAGNYPNNPTKKIKNHYKCFFSHFAQYLPCTLCRISYNEILTRFKIDGYLSSRKKLITWLYLVKDTVNRKLIIQERDEVERVMQSNTNTKSRREVEERVIYTQPSPPLRAVLKKYV